ncbi:MAG: LacI family DNA-binding transcriptional regulator [Limnochordaceae bacterium]|nr:LacI family DNA-binding transcriptional regulator [Limnochordaceae bacterium]
MKLKEVAKQLGLAPSTVSRALNHPEMVSAETRVRVEEAVRRVRYQPDRIARSLRVRQTSTIGLVVSDILNPFHAALASAIEEAAQQHGFTVILGNSNEDIQREQAYLEVLVASRVRGVILVPSGVNTKGVQWVVGQGVPLVQVDRLTPGVKTDAVLLDNQRGAALAVEHLVGLGHRRIAMIAGPPHLTTGEQRLQGYWAALERAQIRPDERWVFPGNFRESGGYNGARSLLSLPPDVRPTALITANNEMAAGAVKALGELGLALGRDVSLVTFDDARWAQYILPPLTVVAQPVEEIGQTAVDVLFRHFAGGSGLPARPTVYTLQPYLVARASTRPPAVGASKEEVEARLPNLES